MSADLSRLPDIATQRGADPELLREELLHIIRAASDNAPRSLQKKIGPSEIGTPCSRRLGHKLAGTTEKPGGDSWRTTVGTAVHEWLAGVFTAANSGLPDARWLVEMRVQAGSIDGVTLDGSTDLYDRVTATVLDWKTTSTSKLKVYKASGPGEQYRVQAMTYGLGWLNRGLPVDQVAIFFLPRDGQLSQAHWHVEPFDEQVARDAIARADAIAKAGRLAGWAQVLPQLPTADAYCTFCPFFRRGATDLTSGCPGHEGARGTEAPTPLHDLIAIPA